MFWTKNKDIKQLNKACSIKGGVLKVDFSKSKGYWDIQSCTKRVVQMLIDKNLDDYHFDSDNEASKVLKQRGATKATIKYILQEWRKP